MLRLWFLILCVLAGAFAPVRADARGAENRTRDFFATSAETHQENSSQAVEPHKEKTADGYETALGYPQAAENIPIRWGPATGAGPLGEKVAATFRGASYTESVTSEVTTLYRVYGGKAGQLGPYWTRTAPTGPLQSRLDSALLSEWGGDASKVVRIQVPKGTTIFDGFAAPQTGTLKPFENLVGGGSQVYIPKVDPSWIAP